MTPTRYTDAQISRAVHRALGGDVCLEEAVHALVFPDEEVTRVWGEWDPEQRDAWDAAARLYHDLGGTLRVEGRRTPNPPTVQSSWAAILEVLKTGEYEWPAVHGVTWNILAQLLSIGPRAAVYHYKRLGWELGGPPGARYVVMAPCILCGHVQPARMLVDSAGPCCLRQSA
jgi:hypothetical protein